VLDVLLLGLLVILILEEGPRVVFLKELFERHFILLPLIDDQVLEFVLFSQDVIEFILLNVSVDFHVTMARVNGRVLASNYIPWNCFADRSEGDTIVRSSLASG